MYGDLFHIKKNKEFLIDQKKIFIKCEEQKKLKIEKEKKNNKDADVYFCLR